MHLLVSLCNLAQPDTTGLLLVDAENEETRPVAIGAPTAGVLGCVGLWGDRSVVYCAWAAADGRPYVSVLDKRTLAVLEVAALDGVRDVHSVSVVESFLYVVSTGTDEVRRVPTDRLGAPSEVVWQATDAGCDTHHVNAILPVKGRLFCSAFGPKNGDRWSTALAGYVVDIESGDIIERGIEHPHSLAVAPDDLYVAESRRARVYGIAHHRTFEVEGYARGLCVLPDGFVVGLSRGRARSRSLGTIENAADPGERAGDMGLAFFRQSDSPPGAKPYARLDLSAYGPEVYDVMLLP
jgi:hypothetical protein